MKRDAAILLLFAYRHVGYYGWLPEQQGYVFTAAGSLCLIFFLLWMRPWWPIALWALTEEFMVGGCSAWWLLSPIAERTDELCSQRLGFRIGAVGLAALSIVAWRFTLTRLTGSEVTNGERK